MEALIGGTSGNSRPYFFVIKDSRSILIQLDARDAESAHKARRAGGVSAQAGKTNRPLLMKYCLPWNDVVFLQSEGLSECPFRSRPKGMP